MESYKKYCENIAQELGITYWQAQNVAYLRERSRHTPALENKLVEFYRQGYDPIIGSFDEDWQPEK